MSKAVRKLPLFIDEEQANQLRAKLLMYRFKNVGKSLNKMNYESFNNSRVAEIFYPLLSVAPNPEIYKRLEEYALNLCKIQEEDEKLSLEAQIVLIVLDSYEKMIEGKISIKEITETFNSDLSVNEQIKSFSVGRVLSRLGFEKVRMPDKKGSRGIRWNNDLIIRLAKRYGLEDKLPGKIFLLPGYVSEPSEQSDQLTSIKAISDTSDRSDRLLDTYAPQISDDRDIEKTDREAILAKLRMIGGPFSQDFAIEQIQRITEDRKDATEWFKQLEKEGLLDKDPEGYWRLIQ